MAWKGWEAFSPETRGIAARRMQEFRERPTEAATKYHNRKTEVDGLVFDSKKEAQRWQDLHIWLRAGLIRDLERQVSYDLVVNGALICRYRPDFRYTNILLGDTVVEDVKGVKTPVYVLKKKLMKAIHNIDVVEL